MDRRKSLKSLLAGTVGGSIILNGCEQSTENTTPDAPVIDNQGYGRVAEETARDQKLMADQFFNDHEMKTISVLCDWILPATETAGAATEAQVPSFIEFIVKDLPEHQLPMRGGLMWLDQHCNKLYQTVFIDCDAQKQQTVLDQIAYPLKADPSVSQGVKFFTLMRNLTMTGYYTTKMGIDDLGYQGNTPNVWDGVPDDVLKKHGLSYDEEWLSKCVDQSTRNDIASWDDEGNLIS